MRFFYGGFKGRSEEGLNFEFNVWGNSVNNICRKVEDCSQVNDLELGVGSGSDNITFKFSIQLNIRHCRFSGRNQFECHEVIEKHRFINIHQV